VLDDSQPKSIQIHIYNGSDEKHSRERNENECGILNIQLLSIGLTLLEN
jgi:hypothetical protein